MNRNLICQLCDPPPSWMKACWPVRSALALSGVLALANTLDAHPLDHWSARHTNAASVYFFGVTYGNGLFVAVGTGGLIATSPDGKNWTTNPPPTSATLWAVTFGGGQFVAVGASGTILTSADAVTWTPRSYGGTATLSGVKYGNSVFVAVSGLQAFPLTSTDGITWTVQSFSFASQLGILVSGNGLFIYPDRAGTNSLSHDGTNWWRQSSGTTNGLYTMGFGNGMFVAVHDKTLTSPDGTNWTVHSTIPLVRPEEFAYGNGVWVAVSRGGAPVYSSDLESWKIVTSAPTIPYVAFGNGTFVAVFDRIIQSDPVIQLQAAPGSLLLSGPTNAIYRIEATGDPGVSNSWQLLTNVLVDTSPYVWSDPDFANHDRRFYRALLP